MNPILARSPAMLLATMGILAGCSSQNLKVLAEPPSVTITEPSVDSQFYEGQSISHGARRAGKRQRRLASISHRWVSGNETMCDSDAVGVDGYAYCPLRSRRPERRRSR